MKKLVFACLGIMLLGASCSKQADETIQSQPDPSKTAILNGDKSWTESEGVGYCIPQNGACHDMRVCWPQEMSGMQTAVGNGPSGISAYFTVTENQTLFAECGVESGDFDNLTSGNYNIIIQVDASDPDLYYFLVGPTSTLTNSNPEYVLQFKVEDE